MSYYSPKCATEFAAEANEVRVRVRVKVRVSVRVRVRVGVRVRVRVGVRVRAKSLGTPRCSMVMRMFILKNLCCVRVRVRVGVKCKG